MQGHTSNKSSFKDTVGHYQGLWWLLHDNKCLNPDVFPTRHAIALKAVRDKEACVQQRPEISTNSSSHLQIQVRDYRPFLLLLKWSGVYYLGWDRELGKGNRISEETWKQIPNVSGRSPLGPPAASLPRIPCIPQLQKFSSLLLLLSSCTWGMATRYLFLWWCPLATNWLYTDY